MLNFCNLYQSSKLFSIWPTGDKRAINLLSFIFRAYSRSLFGATFTPNLAPWVLKKIFSLEMVKNNFCLGGASKQNVFSENVPWKIAAIPPMSKIGPDFVYPFISDKKLALHAKTTFKASNFYFAQILWGRYFISTSFAPHLFLLGWLKLNLAL